MLIFKCLQFDNQVLTQLNHEDWDEESECLKL